MYIEVGVKVLLQNEEGNYLLVRRNPILYPEIGATWDIVGGRITAGVPLLENLAREVREETGLTITSDPVLFAAQDILGIERFPDRHVVRLTYGAKTTGTPTLDNESLEYKWFTKDELLAMPSEGLDRFFKQLLAMQHIAW